jgi:threonine synthase
MICLATAHPAKFGEAIREAVGEDLAHHPLLDALAVMPVRRTILPNSTDAIRTFVSDHT